MKALILNSGLATRLKPLTDNMPKCLLDINGKTLLQLQIEAFLKSGVTSFVITTGPFEEQTIEHVADKFPGLDVTFVNSSKYAETNYIYSMWLAKEHLDDDVLYLHGDLLFAQDLMDKIVSSEKKTCALVNKDIPPPEKDFKARIVDGRVSEIGVNISGEGVYFCAPLYKLSKKDFGRWMVEIDRFVSGGNVKCYAENAFNKISSKLVLEPLYFDEMCMEIDDLDDLEKARKLESF